MAELDKTFEFGLTVSKARRDENGRMIVTGYASDTLKDSHKEKFDAHAMKGMLDAVRRGVPLMTSHKDSFGFGESIDGRVLPVEEGDLGLEVDFFLKEEYPQSKELFDEVETGDCKKQLSVGGKLRMENPRCAFMLRDGTKVLHDFELDHFCTTRPKKAANNRTHFKTAIFKSLEDSGMTEEVWKSVEIDDAEAATIARENGDIEKFFMMMPGSMEGRPRQDVDRDDDILEGKDRSFDDLPSFKDMSDHGFNSYQVPLYWEGHPVVTALRDVKQGRNKVVKQLGRYPLEDVSEMMKRSGVKNPGAVADEGGKVGLFAAYTGAENLDDRAVGKDPTGTRAVRYYRVFPSQVNNEGDSEFDDIGRLQGGGFLFSKEGRMLPGEEGYSPFWRVPTMTEAQLLIPDSVAKLAETSKNIEVDAEVEKSIELKRISLMPLGLRKIKIRTKPTDNHSHELRIFLNSGSKVVDGYTVDGGSEFGHGRRAQSPQPVQGDTETFRLRHDHVHTIVRQGGKMVLSEALGHTHAFELPEMAKEVGDMAFKESVRQRAVADGGYFAVGEKGSGAEVYEEAPKTSDLTQTGQSSYALLLTHDGGQHVRQLGKISKMEAHRAAVGAARPGAGKIMVGRSVGRLGKRNLYRALTEFQDGSAEADKVVAYKGYPLADTRAWSFSSGEGKAILENFGGEESDRAWKAYENAHGWVNPEAGDNNPPRVREAYSLPHHKLADGEMKTFPGGVIAATAAINGARGGVTKIPPGERRGVYNHLARHYRQMNMTPPPFRGVKEEGKEIPVGFVDEAYVTEMTEFHKEQGVDVSWLLEYFKDEPKKDEEVNKMGGEQEEKKTETSTPEEAETKPADAPTDGKEDAPKEETAKPDGKEEASGIAARLGKAVLEGLGLKKPANPKVERTVSLIESAKETLAGVDLSGDDAAPLIGQFAALTETVKAAVEAGKIDLDELPSKDAKIIEAFLSAGTLPKVETPSEEEKEEAPKVETPPVEAPKEEGVDYDKLADALGKKFKLVPKDEAPEEEAPKEEGGEDPPADPPADDAPTDGGDAPEEKGDKEKSDDPEGTVEKDSDKLDQILSTLQGLEGRVEKVENVSGVSKSLGGQETETTRKKGIFSGVIPHVDKARAIAASKKTQG